MDLLSHPFRLTAGGRLATVVDGSEEAQAEALAGVVLTRRGERELAPELGITDPVFAGIDLAQVNASLDTYGPAIRANGLEVTYPTPTTSRSVLTYEEVL